MKCTLLLPVSSCLAYIEGYNYFIIFSLLPPPVSPRSLTQTGKDMAAAAASQPAPQNLPLLVAKLYDADSDIRFMSLTDLQTIFQSSQSSSKLTTICTTFRFLLGSLFPGAKLMMLYQFDTDR